MGKARRLWEQERAAQIQKYVSSLNGRQENPVPDHREVVRKIVADVVKGCEGFLVRDPAAFDPQMRTRDEGKIAVAAARFLFTRYRVPRHLEQVWASAYAKKLTDAELLTRKLWYLTVAQGGSLHKDFTHTIFNKKQTHYFLTAPEMPYEEAIWFAVARSFTDQIGVCLKVCRSKILRQPVNEFWKDAVRFFCLYPPASTAEIGDLIDYIQMRRNENSNFSLKGRNLDALREQMLAWHRDLARMKRIGGGSWIGLDAPDFTFVQPDAQNPSKDRTWIVSQIKTGNDLAKEGNAMHHCVASYKHHCVSGRTSIWSLRVKTWVEEKRVLTIEVNNTTREIVQVRGYANRMATQAEWFILNKWVASGSVEISRRIY